MRDFHYEAIDFDSSKSSECNLILCGSVIGLSFYAIDTTKRKLVFASNYSFQHHLKERVYRNLMDLLIGTPHLCFPFRETKLFWHAPSCCLVPEEYYSPERSKDFLQIATGNKNIPETIAKFYPPMKAWVIYEGNTEMESLAKEALNVEVLPHVFALLDNAKITYNHRRLVYLNMVSGSVDAIVQDRSKLLLCQSFSIEEMNSITYQGMAALFPQGCRVEWVISGIQNLSTEEQKKVRTSLPAYSIALPSQKRVFAKLKGSPLFLREYLLNTSLSF